MKIQERASPNFNERAPNIPLQFIILHYTGMESADEALSRMCDPKTEVSAHYMIDASGIIFRLVDEKFRAWHAGKSFWQGISDINSASIGIELANPGHEFGYCLFPDVQIMSLKKLMHDIMQRHDIPSYAVLAHSDIAPTRKEDPGELFPWKNLAQEGLGIWPTPSDSDYSTHEEDEVSRILKEVGYDCEDFEATVLAFQRRYYPENLTGIPDDETVARLRSLKNIISSQLTAHPRA